jgi:hexosaminidase
MRDQLLIAKVHSSLRLGAVIVAMASGMLSIQTKKASAQNKPDSIASRLVIPVPASARLSVTRRFTIGDGTSVVIDQDASPEVEGVANFLAALIGGSEPRPVRRVARGQTGKGNIHLGIDEASGGGEEGYRLEISPTEVNLTARAAAGLFYGAQTIRQLLPAAVEEHAAIGRSLWMPTGTITDAPRYAWRGAMLDVARHFLPAADVKRMIDVMAMYKLNRLHLHLADDQGWRIEIESWPELTRRGGSTEVGGGPGGYYTQEEFRDLVAYASARFITIVPEIDMPGHINAALASYPELNCDGKSPPLYTGTRVGFSAICVGRDTVYAFIDDVVREILAMLPTRYFHMGGDEVERLTREQYIGFVERVQKIVTNRGGLMIGWGEIAPAKLNAESIVQHWRRDSVQLHAARGGKVILSPSSRLYLDMKYDSTKTLGLKWAGYIPVRKAYDWDPASLIAGVPDEAIAGVEAPLWSETLEDRADFEYMAFPRLIGVAEIGWSPRRLRQWESYRVRLGAQGPRLQALGVNAFRSPEIPWQH